MSTRPEPVFLDRPYTEILAGWPDDLKARHIARADALVRDGGWNRPAAEYLAFEQMHDEAGRTRDGHRKGD